MRKREQRSYNLLREFVHRTITLLGAIVFTIAFFLVLPLTQTLTNAPATVFISVNVDVVEMDAPPPPPEIEEEPEPEPEEPPPELTEITPPLDLSQLEMALNPTFGDDLLRGDFALQLNTVVSDSKENDALFSLSDLDQKPRIIYQPAPVMNNEMRRKTPGTVYVIFIVDQQGRVDNPIVQQSSDSVFERSAIAAVRQWRFEPGKRNGQPVRFRMRAPIIFPKE